MSLGNAAFFNCGVLGIAHATAAEFTIESSLTVEGAITQRRLVHPSYQTSGITAVGIGADGNSTDILTDLSGDRAILYGARLCISYQPSAVNVFTVNIRILKLEVPERCALRLGDKAGRLLRPGRYLKILDTEAVGIVTAGKGSALRNRSKRAAGHIDSRRLLVESTGKLGGIGAIGVFRQINKVLRCCNIIRFRLCTLAAAE